MPSTFFGLNIAASGMSTYMAGLNTSAHNIANKDTKGYSKQSVSQQAKEAISYKTSYGMVGAGVNALDITSSRDVYYDYKYRKSNAVFGYYETLDHYMKNVEDYLYAKDEKSGGITNSLNDFFATISEQTTDASDTTIRRNVVGAADTLMSFVQETANNLLQAQQEINTQIKSITERINAYAKQIASLNNQINTLEVYGGTANDLRDQRATILDDLAKLVDIEVVSDSPKDGQGMEEFLVFIGDGTLVDTYNYMQLEIVTSDYKAAQTDNEGLYTLQWSNGQTFNIRSSILGGELQGLFEVRDGNNAENFRAGLVGDGYNIGDQTLKLQASANDFVCSGNSWDLSKLNIPESDGIIKIYNYEFAYDSFEVSVQADGTYEYTFNLSTPLTKGTSDHLNLAMSQGENESWKRTASIGDSVDFRGIPYYMSQLTEFVRTFSANFNQVQNHGYDLYDNAGCDFFVATEIATGNEFTAFDEFIFDNIEKRYYLNGEAKTEEDGEIFHFSSKVATDQTASYYNMTALNIAVAGDVLEDGKLLACSTKPNSGVASYENLARMSALREDNSMFKQGIPSNFLAVMTATVGVDGNKVSTCSTNSENIVHAVDNRRLSKAGVDEDEEGQNLIEFQNMLNIQYRVISIMNQVLDKLINSTGL